MKKRFVRCPVGLFDDPRALALTDRLGGATAAAWPLSLWMYASDYFPEGTIPAKYARAIERYVEWTGRKGALFAALVETGWLSIEPCGDVRIIDWDDVRPDPGEWDRSAVAFVYERDCHTCRYCGSTDRLSIDHVIPRCQGGGDEAENLVVACVFCNSRKGGRTPEQAGMTLRPEVLS